MGVGDTPLGPLSITFTECSFLSHSSVVFQLSLSKFSFALEKCSFEDEEQVLAGDIANTNLTIANSTMSNSLGPLVSLDLNGVLEVKHCSFANITDGPAFYVLGHDVATSLVSLRDLHLFNITNLNQIVVGILLNTQYTSVSVVNVELRNFTAYLCGIAYVSFAVFESEGMKAYDGLAVQSVLGIYQRSTCLWRDTLYDNLTCGGQMWSLLTLEGTIDGIVYSHILGTYRAVHGLYTTNFMMVVSASVKVNALRTTLVRQGTPLLFGNVANITVTNSHFEGPLGFALLTVQNSHAWIKNTTMDFSIGRSVYQIVFGAVVEVESCKLRNTVLSGPLVITSTASSLHVKEMELVNVTAQSLSKGSNFTLIVDQASITNCRIGSLAFFSILAQVSFGDLTIRDTVGDLFSLFSSTWSVRRSQISNMTTSGTLMYLSHSYAHFGTSTLANLTLNSVGSLANVINQSVLQFHQVTLEHISSSEHGIISLHKSSLAVTVLINPRLEHGVDSGGEVHYCSDHFECHQDNAGTR